MLRSLILFVFSCSISYQGIALRFPSAARITALGNCGATLIDPWCSFQNPASAALLSNASFGVNAENHFGIKELNTFLFTSVLPVKSIGIFSLNGFRNGGDEFADQLFQLSFAKKLTPKFSYGLSIIHLSSYLKNEKTGLSNLWTVRAGILFLPVQNLWLGMSIFNPSSARLSNSTSERLLSEFRIGANYSFSSKVRCYTDALKKSLQVIRFCSGLEYQPSQAVSVRCGMMTAPIQISYGFGLKFRNISIDAAAECLSVLGISPSVSIIYELDEK